jgi:diaminohydroxyphosphoribosylaminopyrimidine deaminase/5-amino-6-(5-phosphoribosylamino)uracil reductase
MATLLKGSTTDRVLMRVALKEASRGLGRTAPNPAVGCVIVDAGGQEIARGFHARAGLPHAEAVALSVAGARAAGATVYVTLEPCAHWGRTPPDALIRAEVARVVVATTDPDERVSGRGIQRMLDAGIQVDVGVEQQAARRLLEGYLKVRKTGLPFLVLKMAMTLDGKIASRTGDSKWVTSARARSYVQAMRDTADAVMVGVGTALADDPSLTVRLDELPAGPQRELRQPLRVILDSRARLPVSARVLREPGQCVIITTDAARTSDLRALEDVGAEIAVVDMTAGHVAPDAAMLYLAQRGVQKVILEGGGAVASSFVLQGLVSRVAFFIAPKLLSGNEAPGPLGGQGPVLMREAIPVGSLRVRRFTPDILIEADIPG